MQTLKILFYGDDRIDSGFTVAQLIKFITGGLKKVVDVQVTFVHRHRDLLNRQEVQGANKLAWQFLNRYDELWIFGDKQANVVSNDVKRAQPYNELDEYERAVLLEWMKSRGLMITGDHSQIFPNEDDYCDKDHSRFINLGAAIGRYVPRAHQLRVWDGPPTRCDAPLFDNQNTVSGPDLSSLDNNDLLQVDQTPQQIVTQVKPHPLFSWIKPDGQVGPITVFPDHQHEGKVLAPKAEELDQDWPQGASPPEVVAWGHDKRPVVNGREYALVVAFDGDPVNVGRIVADSSFHHYIDLNLDGFDGKDCDGNPKPGTTLDQIAQYYCNLALWLAPKAKRDQLKNEVLLKLATHPIVMGARGTELEILGKIARKTAQIEIGSANVYRILGFANKDEGDASDLISTAFGNFVPAAALNLPTTEAVLGSIVREFHDYFAAQGVTPSSGEAVPAESIVDNGLVRALR